MGLLASWGRTLTSRRLFFDLVGLGSIRDDDLEAILRSRQVANAQRLKLVSLVAGVLVLLQFFVIAIDSDIARKPAVYFSYLALFGTGFSLSMVLYVLWSRGGLRRGQAWYVAYVLFEGVGLCLCDLQLTGDYSTFILVLFGTALLYSAPLQWYLGAFTLCWLGLMLGMTITNPFAVGLTAWAAVTVLTVIGITAAILLEVSRIKAEVLSLELERRNQEWKEASLRDALTGLHNRRFLFEWMEKQLAQARRTGQSLAVVLIDLDHFKTVNDQAGHDAGDQVLQEAAARFLAGVRGADVVARYGGEEFLLALPDTDLDAAQILLGRILEGFRTHPMAGWPHPVTFSAGLTGLTAEDTVKSLFHRADLLLYEAKNGGRNRIVVG